MSRRRRSRTSEAHYPQYEWALDAAGQPVHISHARRGDRFICPVCQGRMVARRGDIIRHHFAHVYVNVCQPQEVTRLAATRWIVQQLSEALAAGQPVPLTYECPLCTQTHTTDLLARVARIQTDHTHDALTSAIALLTAEDTVRAAIRLDTPPADGLRAYITAGITLLALNLERPSGELPDVAALLGRAAIYGGTCTTQDAAARLGVVTDITALRELLTLAVRHPPHYIYGPLEERDDLTHVFALGHQHLWLPPILWERAIGGLHHAINPALQIMTQEWPQDDGATIALYYVTARDTYAIAVRRFAPGAPVYARLETAIFHTDRLTAQLVAKSFAEV
jgi:hypothetical protein